MDHLAELTRAIDGYQSTTASALEQTTKDIKKLNDRADQLEVRMNRPRVGGYDGPSAGELEAKAFTSFMRHGREGMPPEEVRSLQVSDDTTGGYLAPPEFVRELLRSLVAFSPIRALSRVVSITAGAALLPKRTGTPCFEENVGETI